MTTEGGLDVAGQLDKMSVAVERLAQAGILVSLFIDPDHRQIDAAVAVGAPYIEIHTGATRKRRASWRYRPSCAASRSPPPTRPRRG
ncbi:hypothetical protein AK51_05100 [Serratia nematodiphila DZ0503SBS1]|nr:hypothetical protein AK51_05100 [Serratia nematodiphila DZ0503SBS1]